MGLAADLSSLPRATEAEAASGLAPDTAPRFAPLLAELWALDNAAQGDRPTAVPGTRFRYSDAGKCSRAIAYKAAGIDRTNPMDLSGVWNTRLGTLIHDAWQQALQIAYPGAAVEVKVGIAGLDGSGHGDATVTVDDGSTVVVIELKTIGGYGYKSAIGKAARGRPAEGPKTEHIIQASLAAKAQDADEVVIAYLAKETLSVNAAKGLPEALRFAAEWTFTREQYEPFADAEIARVQGIHALLDERGELAARKVPYEMPAGAEIVDVAASRWELHDDEGRIVDTGTLWNGSFCDYCGWRDVCVTTKPGRVPADQVVELRTKWVA